MNIWGFVIGGAIMLVVIIAVYSVLIENCEDKIEELENRIKFQDKSISELEKTISQYMEKHNRLCTDYNRTSFKVYSLEDRIDKLQQNKKDKTEEDIINEELLKYSKECAKAVEDRLNKKGDGK